MKKSIGLLMIVMAVISLAFVSCDANTAPQTDTLGEIYLSNESQSRGITAEGTNAHEVENLFWYYKAEKKDNGLFNTGATKGFVPVKTNTEGAVAGLSEANLGLFSYGNWTFTFCGVKEKLSGTIPASTIDSDLIVYSGSQTIEVNKDKNFLNLTLNEGAGLTTEIKFDTDEGVWFSHANIKKEGMSFSLAVVDKVNGEDKGSFNTGTATVEDGKVSFKGITYTAPSTGIAEGQHVMTFTLTQSEIEGTATTSIAKVATYELAYTVSKGMTYTVKGDLTSAEVQGEVSVGSYAVSVPATTASKVIPVESADSKVVKTETTVSTLDLTVKYPVGAVLTDTTNTAVNGSSVKADAKIGFELKADKTGGITVNTASQEQTTYELTLNVDQNNETLVEVSKFIGKDLEIEAVYHSSVLVPLYSEELAAGAEYYKYNPSDGILKLYVKHASPIDVVTKKVLAVASIGDCKYTTVEAALEDAIEGDTIVLNVGEYEPFCINIANITIKGTVGTSKAKSTVIKSTDDFVNGGETGLQSGNLTIRATGVTIDSVWFDVSTKQSTGTWTTRGAFFAGTENVTIKNCMIEGSGNDDGSVAACFYGEKLTITGCTFKDFERGIYHMGDNISDPQFTITNNVFENVLVPFDTYVSQPLSSVSADSYITITGNTVTGSTPSYIQVWDHAQWTKRNQTLDSYAAIKNVNLDNNGNIVYYLTHFNMLTENSGVNVNTKENQELKYRSYVEVDSSCVIDIPLNANPYGSVKHSDGSEITDWNEHPFIRKEGSKYYIYTITPGEYKLLTTDSGTKITDFSVAEQQLGTIQKIVAPVKVCSESEFKTALKNASIKEIVVTSNITFTSTNEITRDVIIDVGTYCLKTEDRIGRETNSVFSISKGHLILKGNEDGLVKSGTAYDMTYSRSNPTISMYNPGCLTIEGITVEGPDAENRTDKTAYYEAGEAIEALSKKGISETGSITIKNAKIKGGIVPDDVPNSSSSYALSAGGMFIVDIDNSVFSTGYTHSGSGNSYNTTIYFSGNTNVTMSNSTVTAPIKYLPQYGEDYRSTSAIYHAGGSSNNYGTITFINCNLYGKNNSDTPGALTLNGFCNIYCENTTIKADGSSDKTYDISLGASGKTVNFYVKGIDNISSLRKYKSGSSIINVLSWTD